MRRVTDVYPVSTLTEAGLLSGTSRRDTAPNATGGLLKEIGEFGIIVCKDFTSVLNMHREQRQAVLAALREIYDGSWTRVLGTDGGRTLSWKGKVGFLGGVTPTIDTHHSVMATMGERFVLYRMSAADEEQQARAALAHARHGARMRDDLSSAVNDFFKGSSLEDVPTGPTEETYLVTLAQLVARCRSAVERDSYGREIELIPDPEAPGRIVIVLDRLRAGLRAIGVSHPEVWRILRKVALDCVPVIRRHLIRDLAGRAEGHKISDLRSPFHRGRARARLFFSRATSLSFG